MKEIQVKAYAKINLSLDVLSKREDGYHEVCMIMQQIDLWDDVSLTLKDEFVTKPISITTNLKDMPTNQDNLAYKAASLMLSHYGENTGDSIGIHLEKRIPVAAGLAGGSADAAAVLHALNLLWDLELSLVQLMNLGVKLGADVPFCLMGQAALETRLGFTKGPISTCALATGIGEILTPLPPVNAWIVLSKPPIQVSTAEIYGALRLEEITNRPDTEQLIKGLAEEDFNKVASSMFNVLQPISEKRYPLIVSTRNIMNVEASNYKIIMCGSGPTVLAITPENSIAQELFKKAYKYNTDTFLIKSL